MGKLVNYFCDFCDKELNKDPYRSDGNLIKIESKTFCFSDISKREDFSEELYLCDKHRNLLKKFINDSVVKHKENNE